jgi:CubicO group peptidase (beta-lactamase class C family)
MQREGLAFGEAWDVVKAARPSANPNRGFIAQLKAASKTPEVHGTCAPEFEPVRALLVQHLDTGVTCGASVSLVVQGVTKVDLWGGYTDRTRTVKWAKTTVVNVWSVTKSWTAICCHVLHDRGLLDYDAPIATYWPEFGCAGKEQATVRHALSHAAGVPVLETAVFDTTKLADWAYVTALLARQPALWPPGSHHQYHAFTFGHLVGELVRRCDPAGRTVGRFFREEVLEKLGLVGELVLGAAPPDRCANVYWDNAASDYEGDLDADAFGMEANALLAKYRAWASLADGDAKEARRSEAAAALRAHRSMNPRRTTAVVNGAVWRSAEFPASGGHASARGLAKLFGHLASSDGDGVICAETLAEVTATCWGCISGQPWGGGVSLRPLGADLTPNGFGHAGLGGSLAFADPDRQLGFGYAMNCLRRGDGHAIGDGPAVHLARVCYDCLGAAPT